jgi:hypothetical protein
MTNKEIIIKWVEIFNSGDANSLSEFYSDNAINHQVANDPVEGKEAIREMFMEEFAQYKMECIIENLFDDGDWVILEWKDPLGLRGCRFFKIENNKIVFQRGYWDKLSFLREHNLPIPPN